MSVSAGRTEILSAVDFTAEAGRVTAIVGPNGSGKTTLLRALTGEVEYRGEVRLNGHDIARARAWELAGLRAVLSQATTLAFPFTVAEIVRMGQTAGTSAPAGDLVGRALAMLDLGGYGGRFYQELSGGEQQRVQLARVLCQVWQPVGPDGPRWLLLDEPVSSLDIGHQLQVTGLIRDFAMRGGGVVAVMHDLNLTALAADTATMMSGGRVLAAGPTHDVLTDRVLERAYGCALRVNRLPDPATLFVLPQSVARVA